MSGVIDIVGEKLMGDPGSRRPIHTQADLALAVQDRLPLATLKNMVRAGLTEQEIERLVIPQRTQRHRAAKAQTLTVDESDRAVRLLRIQTIAEETFGDHVKAALWLRRPLTELGGEAPLDVARTEAGGRVIEAILSKIAWGAAA